MKQRACYCYVIMGAALFTFIEAFSVLSPILLSFLLILLISFAINPLISRVGAFTGGRKSATGLLAAAILVFIGLMGWSFSGPLKVPATKFAERLPHYWERIQKPLIKIENQTVLTEAKLQEEVRTEIAKAGTVTNENATENQINPPVSLATQGQSGSLRTSLRQTLEGVAHSFRTVAFNAAEILVVLVTVFFGVTFTLMNPLPILRAFFSIVPAQHHGSALAVMQRIGKFMPSWALATLFSMITIGLLVFFFMWPFFGVTDALVLALIAGVFEAIPFVGPLLSAVPALLFALGEGGMTPVWVLAVYAVIQILENNAISPLIMAHTMKLHPVAVIFSMLLCVAAFGVLGVLVAPPMVAIADILHDELYRKRLLPVSTNAELDSLARNVLREK